MKKLSKNYKYLIWDFDGTVNNTSAGIYATFTEVLRCFGKDAEGIDLSEHIGPPLSYSYTKLLGAENCKRAMDLHCRIFAESNAAENSFLYDGITDVLKTLKDSGRFVLAIASSKYEPHAVESIKYHGLTDFFDYVYGQTEKRGYKEEVIRQLIDDNNWNRNECIMIGDTMHDVLGANRNGVDVIAVTYGFGKADELKSADITAYADSPEQVLQLLL